MMNNVRNVKVENFICPEGMESALRVTGSRNEAVEVESAWISTENASLSKGAAKAVVLK